MCWKKISNWFYSEEKTKKRRLQQKTAKKEEKVSGIGGWLIIPIIGMFYSIIVIIIDILDALSLIGEYSIEWALFLDLGLLVLIGFTLYFIFTKSKKAPVFAIIYLWAIFVNNLIVSSLLEDYSPLLIYLGAAIVWTIYFVKSKRVKNTFVN